MNNQIQPEVIYKFVISIINKLLKDNIITVEDHTKLLTEAQCGYEKKAI